MKVTHILLRNLVCSLDWEFLPLVSPANLSVEGVKICAIKLIFLELLDVKMLYNTLSCSCMRLMFFLLTSCSQRMKKVQTSLYSSMMRLTLNRSPTVPAYIWYIKCLNFFDWSAVLLCQSKIYVSSSFNLKI